MSNFADAANAVRPLPTPEYSEDFVTASHDVAAGRKTPDQAWAWLKDREAAAAARTPSEGTK